ncbi:g11765 [Coccomyxa elongata]
MRKTPRDTASCRFGKCLEACPFGKVRAAAVLVLCCLGSYTQASHPKHKVHTIVPVECTNGYFEWQILGFIYSARRAGQEGPITRLMSCTEEQLKDYKGIDLVPTFVAPSFKNIVPDDEYAAYNKPGAIMAWLEEREPKEDFILIVDADNIMRFPLDPVELKVEPGWAFSGYHFYEILKGCANELADKHIPQVEPRQDTLAGPKGRRADTVGVPILMAKSDLKKVAPLWLEYSRRFRLDPATYNGNLTGDDFTKHPGDKSWMSEMYGYSYGAAVANVWHRKVDYTDSLLPGYAALWPPKILHYGARWSVPNTTWSWHKSWYHNNFDVTACPPWDLSAERPSAGRFPLPPRPLDIPSEGEDFLRDLIAIEPVVVLNAAFCERHMKHCPKSQQLTEECAKVRQQEIELDIAFDVMEVAMQEEECKNKHPDCEEWARNGECEKSPRYMFWGCRLSCGRCFPPTLQVRHHSKVPTTAVAQGSAWPYGAGRKKGSGAWSGAARASTLDGRQWLDAHLELANPVEAMQVVEPLRNSKVHALQLRNKVASRLYRHQASQLHPGGMASGLSHVTEEKMMGDVTFFIVLMGWFGVVLWGLILMYFLGILQ